MLRKPILPCANFPELDWSRVGHTVTIFLLVWASWHHPSNALKKHRFQPQDLLRGVPTDAAPE
eukprot:10081098-Lingulodinium_polyedra.AAC.1